MNELRTENIFAAYRKKEVLRGVSLSVRQGEIVALIGPNGAGKSTLLKVVAGFLKPLNGEVWVNGNEITTLPPHERVECGLSYFMQGGKVFPNLTVSENLEMGSVTLPSEDRGEKVSAVLEVFRNLKDMLYRRAGLLSGGERQALALAMVFVKRPRILLLDEPSSGLSPKLVQEMLAKVRELNNIWQTTILLVEQNVREALNIACRSVALVNGEVALETDKPQGWLAEGQLEKLFLGNDYKTEKV
jgi:branched-chain amino acid transport system ATP-binding protein